MPRTGQRQVSADRHSGTAGGIAAPLEAARPLTVTVLVDPGVAGTRGAQLVTAMLCNILARSIGSVTAAILSCGSVPLADGVLCGTTPDQNFAEAVLAACASIGGVHVTIGDAERVSATQPDNLTIGVGDTDADVTLVCGNWWGGLTTAAAPAFRNDVGHVVLPFGAYAAAAHAAAEVFRRSRIADAVSLIPYVHDLWNQRVTTEPDELPADDWLPKALHLDAVLAGVGAVGNAWLAAIWATPSLTGTILYADADHVDDTNLNRCVLFNLASGGLLKTEVVEPLLTDAVNQLAWTRTDTLVQASDKLTFPVPLLISAVDTNRARRDLQSLNPQRILAASTHNLRADLLRPGPPGQGACLLCHNPIEPEVPDRELRARWLAATALEKEQLAATIGETVETLDRWAHQARCGELDARALPVLADTLAVGPRQFSVGFLSLLAGVMLAAETVKEAAGVAEGLDETQNRAVVQTVTPWSTRNRTGRHAADGACLACSQPRRLAAWTRRYVPRRRAAQKSSRNPEAVVPAW
jgi:hypothetical protein